MKSIFDSNIVKLVIYILVACNFAFAQNINQSVITKAAIDQLDLNQLDQLIELNPTKPVAYCLRAKWYIENGQYQEAITDCNNALQLESNYALAFNERGTAYVALTNFSAAIHDYNHVIQLQPTNSSWTLALRGKAYAGLGDYDRAIADYDNAIRLGVEDCEIYTRRAYAYAQKGENDKAIADFTKSLAYATNNMIPFIYTSRGFIFSLMGNYSNGIEDCEYAVHLAPNYDVANNNLAWLLATAPEADLRNGTIALQYANKACDLSDWKESHYVGTLAAAYAENGDFDEAVKWEKKSIELGLPKNEISKAQKMLRLFEDKKPFHEDVISKISHI